MNYSPLRYPGGKAKLYNLVRYLISQYNGDINTYIEPFAGGAGIAIALLLNNDVRKIIINDINIGVYSFWRAVCNDTDNFLRLLYNTPLDIENYRIQKQIYENETAFSLELGFATFYLNRTNFSGVLEAGPIGGYGQTGKYLMNARYNKNELSKKIQSIATNKARIKIYNKDILDFMKTIECKASKSFTYFDPPYFIKGKALYTNYLNSEDHKTIYESIDKIKTPWLLTYDNVPKIVEIYKKYDPYEFNLSYTVNSLANRKGTELMFSNDSEKLRNINPQITKKINLAKREKVIYES